MAAIHLLTDNSPHDVDIASGTPPVWMLRDTVNSIGTKYGSGA
jgi:hypothetical protein